MQNSTMVFILFVLYLKSQICQFKLKFGTSANSNMQNAMVLLAFLFWTENKLIGQNGFLKLKFSA